MLGSLNRITNRLYQMKLNTLHQFVRTIHDHAHHAIESRQEAQWAEAAVELLEHRHPEFADLHLRRAVGYYVLAILLLAVYLADVLVLTPTAEYLAHLFLASTPWLILPARFIIPVCVLMIELGIASKLYFTREDISDSGSRLAYKAWLVVALIFAIVMPALIVSTHMAAHAGAHSKRLETIFDWQLVALVAIAFATHSLVIFGGKVSHEAKAFFMFRWRHASLCRLLRQSEAGFEQEAQATTHTFISYVRTLAVYNDSVSTPRIAPGPFDLVTRDLLRERFGYEVVPFPHGVWFNKGNGHNDHGQTVMCDPFLISQG